MSSPKLRSYLLIALGVIMVSYSGPLVKAALLQGATPVTIAFMRMLLSALFLLPFALKKPKNAPHSSLKTALQALRTSPNPNILIIILSAFFLALHYATWMTSLSATSTFASVALVCTQPLFVTAFSGIILKESMAKAARPGALIALIGALLIGLGSFNADSNASLFGDLLALTGAMAMAGHWLCGRALRKSLPAMGYMVIAYSLTALFLAILLPFTGGLALPNDAIWYILGLVIGCTLLGHTVFTVALGHVSADIVSFSLLGEPVGAMIWALILFNESPAPMHIIGGLVILIGLCFYLIGNMSRKNLTQPPQK